MARWRSEVTLTRLWRPRFTRVLLQFDGAQDAIPFQETVEALSELIRTYVPHVRAIEVSYGSPLSKEELGKYSQKWKLYESTSTPPLVIGVPLTEGDEQRYLEETLMNTFSGAKVKEPGSPVEREFTTADAKKWSEGFLPKGIRERVDYDRLFQAIQPASLPEDTYLIHVWSDRISEESGGGSSSWAKEAVGSIRLERRLIEAQAVCHISPRTLERSTALHELGHILGLVKNPEHHRKAHCTNPACIMYPGEVSVRTVLANFWSGLLGQPKSSFCAECQADLEFYGQKAEEP